MSLRREIEKREAARTRLLGFATYTMPNYEVGAHHSLICDKLEAVERGECKRLMIFSPPRHGKSEIASKRFPAWFLGRNPGRQIISASYGADLAMDFGRDVRNIVSSPEFGALFPNVGLAADSAAKNRWHTNRGGSYVAAGVGSAITGRGADVLNIDDPVKDRAEAESEIVREAVWSWYTSTAYTRLMPGGSVVLTMTRWHEDDLAGRLLERQQDGDKWEVISLPALADSVDDPLGRCIGDALWPSRYSAEVLQQTRGVVPPHDWFSLYQQQPRPPGGAYFDTEKLLENGAPVDYPAICDTVFAIVDTAVKGGQEHDGTAVSYWAYSRHVGFRLVCLDWDLIQVDGALLEQWIPSVFARLEALAKECRARRGSRGVLIEDAQSGSILLQQCALRRFPAAPLPANLTSAGKDGRAINAGPPVFRGEVKFSRFAYDKVTTFRGHTRNHLLSQVANFRIGDKNAARRADDLFDTFTYAVGVGCGDSKGFA